MQPPAPSTEVDGKSQTGRCVDGSGILNSHGEYPTLNRKRTRQCATARRCRFGQRRQMPAPAVRCFHATRSAEWPPGVRSASKVFEVLVAVCARCEGKV